MQPLNTTVTQNATAVPLANVEGKTAVSCSHILEDEVAGHVDFAGSGVYFHSRSSEPFTVAYILTNINSYYYLIIFIITNLASYYIVSFTQGANQYYCSK